MKRPFLWLLEFALALLAFGAAVVAEDPNYNNGHVWRIIYVDVKPGMGDAFWTDIRQNFKPIYEEFKKQGWIVDYKVYTNPVAAHPDDWSVAIAIEYKNWTTLDEMGHKPGAVVARNFCSRPPIPQPPRTLN